MTATDRIRAAIQRCIDASPAPPTTDDIAAAVLQEAAEVLFPEKPEPIEPIPITATRAINHAGDWSAWRAMKAAKERLQALAQQLDGTDYGNHVPDSRKMVSPADALVARARAVLARPVADGPTRDELWELWLRLNNELPDSQAAVAEFWEHAQIDACVRYGPHPAPPFAEEVGELAAWLHGQDGSTSKRAIYSRAADLLLQQEGRIEQAYQYGRHDAEADAQQASESAEDEPGGLEQRHPTPVPVAEPVAAPAGPTDGELALIYHDFCRGCEFMDQGGFEDAARTLLARWGHQPAPPAEGEVAELVALIRQIALAWEPDACLLGNMTAGQLCRAADLLEQRHPTPVPVSERLPGTGDCDAEGRCWWWYPPVPEQNYGYWIYEDNAVPERSRLEWPDSWLPAHALPLPAGEVE